MSSSIVAEKVAERFSTAFRNGDLAVLEQLFSKDALVWHNFDGKAISLAEEAAIFAHLFRELPERRLENGLVVGFADGYVHQCVLVGRNRANRPVHIPLVFVARVKDELIVRLDEYVDSAQLGQIQMAE